MNSVSQLLGKEDVNFIGDFRCRSPHWITQPRHKRCLHLNLEDYSGTIEGIAIEGEHFSPKELSDMDKIKVSGLLWNHSGHTIAILHEIIRMHPEETGDTKLLPISASRHPDDLSSLVEMEKGLRM